MPGKTIKILQGFFSSPTFWEVLEKNASVRHMNHVTAELLVRNCHLPIITTIAVPAVGDGPTT